MFSNYFKSIFHILENCDSNSNDFHTMLKMNSYFIDNLKFPKNKHALLNNIHTSYQTGSGEHSEALKKLKQSIEDILNSFNELEQGVQHENIDKLALKVKSIQSTINSLTRYIDMLHTFVPNEEEITTLGTQLENISSILSKYL